MSRNPHKRLADYLGAALPIAIFVSMPLAATGLLVWANEHAQAATATQPAAPAQPRRGWHAMPSSFAPIAAAYRCTALQAGAPRCPIPAPAPMPR